MQVYVYTQELHKKHQTSHFWMLNPNNYILENLQWKKYIGIHFEFRRHVVGIICVLLVQGEPP